MQFLFDYFLVGLTVSLFVVFADRVQARWQSMPLGRSRGLGFILSLIMWPAFLYRLLIAPIK